MSDAVVIERANARFSVYVPDRPRCIATAETFEETETETGIREAILSHVDGAREDRLPSPELTTGREHVDVSRAA